MLHVFLAGPDQLDRVGHLHGHAHGILDEIAAEHGGPPSEAAAHLQGVENDIIQLQARCLRRQGSGPQGVLNAGPQLQLAVVAVGGATHGLHGGMGQKRRAILRFQDFAGGGQGQGLSAFALLVIHLDFAIVENGGEVLKHLLRAEIAVAAIGELDGKTRDRLLRAPVVVRCDRHRVRQAQHILNAGEIPNGIRFQGEGFPAETGGVADGGRFHVV